MDGVLFQIILSIQWNGAVHHVPIQECGGNGFCIESATPFASMCQLIDYYTTNAIEYNHEQITLTNPILRQVNLLNPIIEHYWANVMLQGWRKIRVMFSKKASSNALRFYQFLFCVGHFLSY